MFYYMIANKGMILLFTPDSLVESQQGIVDGLPPFGNYVVEEVMAQCSVHLKLVSDIPRMYRRTNREVRVCPVSSDFMFCVLHVYLPMTLPPNNIFEV